MAGQSMTTAAREVASNTCIRCGRRLVVRLGPAGNVVSVLHENGLRQCEPPAAQECVVCTRQALVQCSTTGCELQGHPDCFVQCSCCGRTVCPKHGFNGLCHPCSSREEGHHGHEEDPYGG